MNYPEGAWSNPDIESIKFNSKIQRVGGYVDKLAEKFFNNPNITRLDTVKMNILKHTMSRYVGFNIVEILHATADSPGIPTKKTLRQLLPEQSFLLNFQPYLERQIELYEKRCSDLQTKLNQIEGKDESAIDLDRGYHIKLTTSELTDASLELSRLTQTRNIYLNQEFI